MSNCQHIAHLFLQLAKKMLVFIVTPWSAQLPGRDEMVMQRGILKRLVLNSFTLSILLHLLFLLSITTVIIFEPRPEKKPPHLYVPAYTYTGKVMPQTATSHFASNTIKQPVSKQEEPSKHGIIKKSIMALSMDLLQQNQRRMISSLRNAEPIYLIGDDHQPADPLIKLLGKALSAHFAYPQVAGELGIRGKTLIGMTLSPDGSLSDIQMVRSSNNGDLDAAALYAVNSAPTIRGANRFLSAPKHFIIGFVFK